ncbi:hypothetical protein ACS0TY_000174 [Phlomoides rotata]
MYYTGLRVVHYNLFQIMTTLFCSINSERVVTAMAITDHCVILGDDPELNWGFAEIINFRILQFGGENNDWDFFCKSRELNEFLGFCTCLHFYDHHVLLKNTALLLLHLLQSSCLVEEYISSGLK